jgi:hypothetical protein
MSPPSFATLSTSARYVQSADLVDLMRGFAERFRNEAGLAWI